MSDSYDYESMSKEKLVEHCRAISFALHAVKNECQKLEMRVFLIENHREFFHGEGAAA